MYVALADVIIPYLATPYTKSSGHEKSMQHIKFGIFQQQSCLRQRLRSNTAMIPFWPKRHCRELKTIDGANTFCSFQSYFPNTHPKFSKKIAVLKIYKHAYILAANCLLLHNQF